MTAVTVTRTSAYPPTVDELIPAVRTEVERTGEVPSLNQMMRQYRIGKDKARAVRTAITDPPPAPTDPTEPTPTPEPTPEPTPDPIDTPTGPDAVPAAAEAEAPPLDAVAVDPGTNITTTPTVDAEPVPAKARRPIVWPVLLLCLPAFVAIWSGWVELGGLAGFGIVHPLPGIVDDFTINTAITLPIGVETYAAYALWVWLTGRAPVPARRFAKWSAIGSLIFGAAGQGAYHLLKAAGLTAAPWPITVAVACLPVAVLGMGAALAHLQHVDQS